MNCPECNREVEADAKICPFCGKLLGNMGHVATRSLDNTDFEEGRLQWGTAHFTQRMALVIVVRDTRERFTVPIEDGQEIIIGRMDPHTGEAPQIDLAHSAAIDKGVSRRHAAINRHDTALNIVDLGSPNGSYLNGQRLVAHQGRVLRDGDELRLGHMVLHVTFTYR